jgi:hypothetical protein
VFPKSSPRAWSKLQQTFAEIEIDRRMSAAISWGDAILPIYPEKRDAALQQLMIYS